MRCLLLICCLFFSSLFGDSDWVFRAGIGALSSPRYPGSDEQRFLVLPNLMATYKDVLKFNPRGIQWEPKTEGRFQTGLSLGWNFGRDEDDDRQLKGLGDIDTTFTGTVWGSVAFDRNRYFKNRLSFTHDLNDSYGGFTLKNELSSDVYLMSLGVFGQIGIHGVYGSDDINMAFFGVDREQALNSVYPETDMDAGLQSYGVSTMLLKPLSETWLVNLRLSYDKLTGDVADSPFIDTENLVSGALFATYTFK